MTIPRKEFRRLVTQLSVAPVTHHAQTSYPWLRLSEGAHARQRLVDHLAVLARVEWRPEFTLAWYARCRSRQRELVLQPLAPFAAGSPGPLSGVALQAANLPLPLAPIND